MKVPNRTRARRYSGQEFYKSFEKYKVWKLTILARLGGMLCVFNSLARLGVCCVFSIAFLDFYAQHVYNSTPILTSLRSLDLNLSYVFIILYDLFVTFLSLLCEIVELSKNSLKNLLPK